MTRFFDSVNVVGGLIGTTLAAAFGQYWFLFAGFLVFNIVDWVSGWMKSRMKGEESSKAGAIGAMKKVWYWVVIGAAFFIGFAFEQMGQSIGISLHFMKLMGWFTLANYLVNEIRSIVENLAEMGVPVPGFLVKGLRVTSEKIDNAAAFGEEDDGEKAEDRP